MPGVPFRRDHDRRLIQFAKRMRREPTDAEKRLWLILRGRRLGGFKFRRQVPVAGYILDYYCMRGGLVVECDGGQHSEPGQQAYDERRTGAIAGLGIRVKHPDAVAETIYAALAGDK
jgi:very-short-patch-repair endonuclease